jgi:hypothetical protein
MKYATAISPLAKNAAIDAKNPNKTNMPQTSSIMPAVITNGGSDPPLDIPFGSGGYAKNFWVACKMNNKPTTILSSA